MLLAGRIRRSAIYLLARTFSNIGEDFPDKKIKRNYNPASKTLAELPNQVLLIKDVRRIDKNTFNQLVKQTIKADNFCR